MRNLGFIAILLTIMFAFQNCGKWQSRQGNNNNSRSSETETPPVLKLVVPDHTTENQPFLVEATGGAAPYTFQISPGNLVVEPINEKTFKIINQVDASLQSFQLNVQDSIGNINSKILPVFQTANIFNYNRAQAADHHQGISAILDSKIGHVLIFDSEGKNLNTLGPLGNLQSLFLGQIQIRFDRWGDLFILEESTKLIHVFDGSDGFVFSKTIDLNLDSDLASPVSFKVANQKIYLTDKDKNEVHLYSDLGRPLGERLNIPSTLPEDSEFHDFSLSSDEEYIFIADFGDKQVLIFKNGELIKSLSNVTIKDSSDTYSFFGPKRIFTGSQGQIVLLDEQLREDSSDLDASGQQSVLIINDILSETPNAQILQSKRTSIWHNPTDCINVRNDQISFCNPERHLKVIDFSGSEIKSMSPRISDNSIFRPEYLAMDNNGNFFVSYDSAHVAGFNNSLKRFATTGGWGPGETENRGVDSLLIVDDNLWIASEKSHSIKIYEKDNLQYISTINIVDEIGNPFPVLRIELLDENILIQGNHEKILLYSKNGEFQKSISNFQDPNEAPPQQIDITNIRGIATHPETHLIYILDSSGEKVWAFTEEGQLEAEISIEQFSNFLSITHDGYLLVGNEKFVLIYASRTGELLGTLRIPNTESDPFKKIKATLSYDNRFYLIDHFNQRVQIVPYPDFLK